MVRIDYLADRTVSRIDGVRVRQDTRRREACSCDMSDLDIDSDAIKVCRETSGQKVPEMRLAACNYGTQLWRWLI